MKNNKNGFTLVELLVCIAIIAALGVAIGINMNKINQDTLNKQKKEDYTNIFEASRTYSNLKKDNCLTGINCEIKLSDLDKEGLIDDALLSKLGDITIKIFLNSQNSKDFLVSCGSSELKYSEIDDFNNWKEC